jgi:acyl-CoA reductase-like NAD-dependent aldehyde dehydrogenase
VIQRTVSPVDGSVFVERELATESSIDAALDQVSQAWEMWRQISLTERIDILSRAVDHVTARTDELANELTWQMGRPISQTPGEIAGFAERARTMLHLAPEALSDIEPPPKEGFHRWIRRESAGPVLVLSPWNYPWLCAVNAVWPALVAGNPVVLKHSDQTPLVAERLAEALQSAGLPDGVLRVLHTSHEQTARIVADSRIRRVAFTGSVEGGRAVHRAAAGTFKPVALELGGKDPAYVRADFDVARAAENLVDGAMFNSGQSCCAVERIYVHRSQFEEFVQRYAAIVGQYRLGDPTDEATNLGPVVRKRSAEAIQAQVDDAVRRGATALIDPESFSGHLPGTAYLAPQVLINVAQDMPLMQDETFGPAVGIMAVDSDEDAVAMMNDSAFGLTASIWTADQEAAIAIGEQLDTGTVFMNRCDALDPELAWVGVKDSGQGCSLSILGFDAFTRPKSFHLKR